MRNIKRLLLLLFVPIIGFSLVMPLQAKTRISVTAFEDKTGGSHSCKHHSGYYWNKSLGSAFKEMLVTKLLESNRFDVLEREHIKKIYGSEHQLINAENTASAKKGQFKKAHYTLAAAVTEFQMCRGGLGGGLDIGRIFGVGKVKVGASSISASVAVDIRVIDVETGSILASIRAEGEKNDKSFNVDTLTKGLDFDLATFEQSPIGEATRMAINRAAEKLIKKIPERQDEKVAALTSTSRTPVKFVVCESLEIHRDCYAAKLLKKSPAGDKYYTISLADVDQKGWKKKSNIHKISTLKSKGYYTGERVVVSHKALDPSRNFYDFRTCGVIDNLNKENLVLDCGKGYITLKSELVFAFPKYREAQRRSVAQEPAVSFDSDFE